MSATCGSSLTEKIVEMKPESFSAILKERLLLPVLVEPADECDVRLQLNRKERIEGDNKKLQERNAIRELGGVARASEWESEGGASEEARRANGTRQIGGRMVPDIL